MTKKQRKESYENVRKVWDLADRFPLVDGKQDVDCEITYINLYGSEVTERTKYVRWDGAIVTESNYFILGGFDRVLSVRA